MLDAVTDTLRRASFEARSRLAAAPTLYPLYRATFVARARYKIRRAGDIAPREAVVTRDTELVIDGYQGSANSFATVAFKRAQRRPVRLAHHLHAPSQVVRAVGLGIPVVVTVREPRAAALSLVRRWPHVAAGQALAAYARFYRVLVPVASGVVVSPFEATIGGLDAVIEEVNRQFGTAFDPFVPTPENVAAVRGRGERSDAERAREAAVRAEKEAALGRPDARARLAEAEAVYAAFLAAAGHDDAPTGGGGRRYPPPPDGPSP